MIINAVRLLGEKFDKMIIIKMCISFVSEIQILGTYPEKIIRQVFSTIKIKLHSMIVEDAEPGSALLRFKCQVSAPWLVNLDNSLNFSVPCFP